MAAKSVHVDVVRAGRQNSLLFGENVAKGVVERLQFGRRRFHGAALAADPYAPVVAHRLEAALPGHLDPMHVAGCGRAVPAGCSHRHVAAVLERARQPFSNALDIAADADDIASIVNAQNEHAASGVRKPADGFTHLPKLQAALELGADVLAGGYATFDLMPVHAADSPSQNQRCLPPSRRTVRPSRATGRLRRRVSVLMVKPIGTPRLRVA